MEIIFDNLGFIIEVIKVEFCVCCLLLLLSSGNTNLYSTHGIIKECVWLEQVGGRKEYLMPPEQEVCQGPALNMMKVDVVGEHLCSKLGSKDLSEVNEVRVRGQGKTHPQLVIERLTVAQHVRLYTDGIEDLMRSLVTA